MGLLCAFCDDGLSAAVFPWRTRSRSPAWSTSAHSTASSSLILIPVSASVVSKSRRRGEPLRMIASTPVPA